mmetsp:Transcript_7095/g.15517  ORF Transcript_7095/g.15517 Transcript_7095/m.15517 type:complete len:309 (+) Transcript_7095:1-927(+)
MDSTSKEIADLFFTAGEREHTWNCTDCRKLFRYNVKAAGYGNLAGHVKSQHPQWKQAIDAHRTLENPSMAAYLSVNKTAVDLYQWIDLIVNADLPFSCVDNPTFRKSVKMQSFTARTVKKSMKLLHAEVVKRVSELLPKHFGVVYDGWADGYQHHIVAWFACFWDTERGCREQLLLACGPLLDESNQDADNHIDTLISVLLRYGRDEECLLFLSGDNCSTNTSMGTKMHVPLVGCASHRLNLAVQKLLAPHKAILDKTSAAMKFIKKKSNVRGRLMVHTPLRPVCKNETRWIFDLEHDAALSPTGANP